MQWFRIWLSTFTVIFAIVDPFGYVPIFLAMTASDSEEQRRAMLRTACGTAFVLLVFFTFFGKSILYFFGITMPALQIAGGVILFAIGFEMLKVIPIHEKISASEESEGAAKKDISIVPLAIPMLSGPASIASVIMLTGKNPSWGGYLAIISSVFVTLAFTYLILRSATRVLHFVGATGLKVATRVMGFLLSALAIQFIINGYLGIKG